MKDIQNVPNYKHEILSLEMFFPPIIIAKADYYRKMFNYSKNLYLILAFTELSILSSGHFLYNQILLRIGKKLQKNIIRKELDLSKEKWRSHLVLFELELPSIINFALNYSNFLRYNDNSISVYEYQSLISIIHYCMDSSNRFVIGLPLGVNTKISHDKLKFIFNIEFFINSLLSNHINLSSIHDIIFILQKYKELSLL